RLLVGGAPANGPYSFQFKLFSDANNGIPVNTNNVDNVAVTDGLFTVLIPGSATGSNIFNGEPRWLDVAVRAQGATEFTTLSARQQITSTPYAIHAAQAEGLALT